MNTIFLITTALSVSVDSFICALTLPYQYKNVYQTLLIICIPIFLVCLIGGLGGKTIGALLNSYANLIGGVILITVALINSFSFSKKDEKLLLSRNKHEKVYKELTAVGLAVGFDGAVACFSLVTLGFNVALVITLITFTHAITLYIAIISKKYSVIKGIKFIKIISPLTLTILGILKVFSTF